MKEIKAKKVSYANENLHLNGNYKLQFFFKLKCEWQLLRINYI
jgi:hypothetical protein